MKKEMKITTKQGEVIQMPIFNSQGRQVIMGDYDAFLRVLVHQVKNLEIVAN